MHRPQFVRRGRARFAERVYIGRDAMRRWNVNPNAAPAPAAAQTSERRST
jgi:hypothetical protein